MPQELFDMIADLLEWKDLMSMSMTFTGLNDLVSNSKAFLKGTKFILTNDNKMEKIERKYHHIIVRSVNLLVSRKVLTNICGNLKSLKLNEISIVSKLDLFHLLYGLSLSQLEGLELKDVRIIDRRSLATGDKKWVLPRLDDLTVLSSFSTDQRLSSNSEWIFDLLDVKTLKSLKVSRGKKFNGKSDALINFINKLDELECLDLTFVDFESLSAGASFLEPNVNLEELKIQEMPFGSPRSHQALVSMFKNAKRLTILNDCNKELVTKLFDVCYGTLEFMEFDVSSLGVLEEQFVRVETLLLSGELPPGDEGLEQMFKVFVLIFPILKKLQIPDALLHNFNIMGMFRPIFTSTKSLTIDRLHLQYTIVAIMSFKNLEELEITEFSNKQLGIFKEFSKCFLGLRKLKVHVPQQGLDKFGNRIFKALHAVGMLTDVFEIFDGKNVHRKHRKEIELKEYGKILSEKGRAALNKRWNCHELDDFDEFLVVNERLREIN